MALLATRTADFSAQHSYWDWWAGNQVVDGRLRQTSGSALAQLYPTATTEKFELAGSNAFAELTSNAGTVMANEGQHVYFIVIRDTNNFFWLRVERTATLTRIQCGRKIAGVWTEVGTPVTYSATTHRFLRISESGGVVSWMASENGSNWPTTLATWTHGSAVDFSSGWHVAWEQGDYHTASGTPTFSLEWDNLNIVPGTGGGGGVAEKIGNTGTGAATSSARPIDIKDGAKVTPAISGTLASLTVRLVGAGVAGTQVFRGGLYRESDGALLASTNEGSLSGTASEQEVTMTFPSPPSVNAGTVYRLVMHWGGTTNLVKFKYDNSGDAQASGWAVDSYSNGLSDPAGTWNYEAISPCIYATYAGTGTGTAAPQNTTAPAVTPATNVRVGDTLTTTDGTWTGSPTFARKWQRSGTSSTGGKFELSAPGNPFTPLSSAQAATLIRQNNWEPISGNATYNQTVGVPYSTFNQGIWGSGHPYSRLMQYVDGNFTGQTDEILQWACAKWGWDEDVLRAQAYLESLWRQYGTGDDYGDGCGPRSYGIVQLKSKYPPPGCSGQTDPWWFTWPWSRDSTAFNLDFCMGLMRITYEGESYMGTSYRGDMWGAIAHHYSGHGWVGGDADWYVNAVKNHLANKPWQSWAGWPGYGGGTTWSDISGATATTYVLVTADLDKYVRSYVTATNAGGSTSKESNIVGPVGSSTVTAPTISQAPTISGTAMVGSTLTTTTGTWTGSPTSYAYQWKRYNTLSDANNNVSATNIGTNSASYTLVTADDGKHIRVQVTATNAGGSTAALSNVVSITGVPVNTSAPVISVVGGGALQTGATVETTNGAWTNSPTLYTYEWQRADNLAFSTNVVTISGAANSTYTLDSAESGKYVRSRVTAANQSGSGTAAASNILGAVALAAPTVLTSPSIS